MRVVYTHAGQKLKTHEVTHIGTQRDTPKRRDAIIAAFAMETGGKGHKYLPDLSWHPKDTAPQTTYTGLTTLLSVYLISPYPGRINFAG